VKWTEQLAQIKGDKCESLSLDFSRGTGRLKKAITNLRRGNVPDAVRRELV